MSKVANIAKNTSYFTFALILQKIISFSYFAILARELGPEDLGKYYFAISFTTIFAFVVDLGLTNYLTREASKNQSEAGRILSLILGIKIPLAFLSLIIVVVVINIMGYPVITKDLVYLSSFSMILDSFTAVFFAAIRSFYNLKYESVSSIVFQLIVMVFGLSVLFMNFDLRWQMVALSLASIFNFSYSAIVAKIKFNLRITPSFNYDLTKKIILISVPFAIYTILQRFYTYFDSVLLSRLASDYEVGLYQVPFKIVNALQFLPLAFTASLYPAMSLYWKENKEQLSITFERAMNYLIIISLPISIGTIAMADKIVLLFKSGYSGAVLPLQITIVGVVFNFLSFPIGSLLNACDRQKTNTICMGFSLALSIGMNIVLIPRFQAVGASITNTVTSFSLVIFGMYFIPQLIKYRVKKNMIMIGKCLLAASAMFIFIYLFKQQLNIFLTVIISGVIYFFMLFFAKVFTKEDVMSIRRSFSR